MEQSGSLLIPLTDLLLEDLQVLQSHFQEPSVHGLELRARAERITQLFRCSAQPLITRWQHLLNQVHPTCTERPSLTKECGWKGGDRGGLAQWEKETIKKKKEKMKERLDTRALRDFPS